MVDTAFLGLSFIHTEDTIHLYTPKCYILGEVLCVKSVGLKHWDYLNEPECLSYTERAEIIINFAER